jgi:hypothetical protein
LGMGEWSWCQPFLDGWFGGSRRRVAQWVGHSHFQSVSWLFGRLISSKPLSSFFFWWFRAAGFRKLFGGGFDVQTPYFGSITATQLCYLGKGREVALQLSTSFLEIAKAKWQLWMERQSCFFIRLFTETRRPANLKRTVLGYCDTPL